MQRTTLQERMEEYIEDQERELEALRYDNRVFERENMALERLWLQQVLVIGDARAREETRNAIDQERRRRQNENLEEIGRRSARVIVSVKLRAHGFSEAKRIAREVIRGNPNFRY
jgi:hypothetical protein